MCYNINFLPLPAPPRVSKKREGVIYKNDSAHYVHLPLQPTYGDIGRTLCRFTRHGRRDIKVWWQSNFKKLTLINLLDLALRTVAVLSPQRAAAKQGLNQRCFSGCSGFLSLFFLSCTQAYASPFSTFTFSQHRSPVCLEISMFLYQHG